MKNKYGVMYMNQAGEGGDNGGAPNQPPAPNQPATPAPAASEGSLLGGAGGDNGNDWIPEKYRVQKSDGTFDVESSAKKMAEAYKHLEQKLGAGDVPPKTAEEYAPKLEGEGFNWEEMKNDESMKGFLKGAHAKGLTNDQVSYVLSEYLKTAQNLVQGAVALDQKAAAEDLRKDWRTDAEFNENINSARKAFNAFATDADKERIDEIGNNPIMLRILANIGREMKEDSPVSGQSMGGIDFEVRTAELREQLQKMSVHDPRRKVVSDELSALYNKRYGNKASGAVTA